MRIGVFDSGIGGEAVASRLHTEFPKAEIISVSDREHVPYGNRSPAEILSLTNKAIRPLLETPNDAIVIACNTATSVAITQLRLDYPHQLFIGLEPMIKPAVLLSKTKTIAVCATPATLQSRQYKRSKLLYGATVNIFEPDCSDWAQLIEMNDLNQDAIDSVVLQCLENKADVIVLGCTHYHWIKGEMLRAANDRAIILEPSDAIARRLRQVLNL